MRQVEIESSQGGDHNFKTPGERLARLARRALSME
jgi:hypothetical protein